MRAFFLLPILSLFGCPASVTAEGMDDGFGMGWSAVWFHLEMKQGDAEGITLSNVMGLCAKQQAYWESFEAYTDAYEDADDDCAEIEQPLRDFVAAAEALTFDGANYSSGGPIDDMDDGDYDLGEDAYWSVFGYTDDMDTSYLDDFDADDKISEGCGMDADDMNEEIDGDAWAVEDGELVIDSVNDEANVSGSVEGEMMEGKDEEGAFKATFNAAYCEIEIPDSMGF
ncbi:MAG: hypothetical protein FJ090_14415 [Deltaproteobacteria bacterium]|nr:hypothetical protein [Deltaproteobacteria bacterium]